MSNRDARHGVVGLIKVPADPSVSLGNQNTLTSYTWADTIYFNNFLTYDDITGAVYSGYTQYTTNNHVGNPFLFSNGAHLYSGQIANNYSIFITNKSYLSNIVPTVSNYVRTVVKDPSNRGKPFVEAGGSWTGTESQTYITRISTPGIAGVAKCDVYGPNGVVMSQNNVITSGVPIILSGSMTIQFNSDGPFYLHDSWAVRGVVGGITQFVLDVQWDGTGYVDEIIVKLNADGNTNQTANLLAETGTITINSGLFGQPIKYGVDYGTTEIGSNLHLLIKCKKDNDFDTFRLWQLNVLVGDDNGAEAWQ